MIGGGRRRMRHHQAVPCSMVVAVERWSGRHRRRRGGRCFCSASSSAEKRGELGGDPPPPPFRCARPPAGSCSARTSLGIRLGPFERVLRARRQPTTSAHQVSGRGSGGSTRFVDVRPKRIGVRVGGHTRTGVLTEARGLRVRRAGRKPVFFIPVVSALAPHLVLFPSPEAGGRTSQATRFFHDIARLRLLKRQPPPHAARPIHRRASSPCRDTSRSSVHTSLTFFRPPRREDTPLKRRVSSTISSGCAS